MSINSLEKVRFFGHSIWVQRNRMTNETQLFYCAWDEIILKEHGDVSQNLSFYRIYYWHPLLWKMSQKNKNGRFRLWSQRKTSCWLNFCQKIYKKKSWHTHTLRKKIMIFWFYCRTASIRVQEIFLHKNIIWLWSTT